MYVHIEIDTKPKIGNFGNEGGGVKKNTFYCPQQPMTYDTFAEILQSFNILQNSSNNTLHTLNYVLNARDFAGVF